MISRTYMRMTTNRHKLLPAALSTAALALLLPFVPASRLVAQQSASKLVPPIQETGFEPIFDGKTLTGWDCDPDFWRVENGAIIGETKFNHQPKQNTFCIWKGGEPANFDLKLQYRLTGVNDGNSGIQYRSIERPDVARWVMQGYQADIDLKQQYTGQIYEERARAFVCLRGQISYVPSGQKPGAFGSVGNSEEL